MNLCISRVQRRATLPGSSMSLLSARARQEYGVAMLFHHPQNNLWGILIIQNLSDVLGSKEKNDYKLCDTLHCALIVALLPKHLLYMEPVNSKT